MTAPSSTNTQKPSQSISQQPEVSFPSPTLAPDAQKPSTQSIEIKKEEIKDSLETKKEAFITTMGHKITEETQELKQTLSHLPIDKRILFFVGIGLIFIAFLILLKIYLSLLSFFIILIGGGMIYMGLSTPEKIQALWDKKTSPVQKNEGIKKNKS